MGPQARRTTLRRLSTRMTFNQNVHHLFCTFAGSGPAGATCRLFLNRHVPAMGSGRRPRGRMDLGIAQDPPGGPGGHTHAPKSERQTSPCASVVSCHVSHPPLRKRVVKKNFLLDPFFYFTLQPSPSQKHVAISSARSVLETSSGARA